MKKLFFIAVAMVLLATVNASAQSVDSLTVKGVQVCINDENTVFPVDMSEFLSVKTVMMCPVTVQRGGSDWACIMKDAAGVYYLSFENVKLRVCKEGIVPISAEEYAKAAKNCSFVSDEDKEFATFAEPMGEAKHKYVWGYDIHRNLYIIVYSRA